MEVIHFTLGATDPLKREGARGVNCVPLAEGAGDAYLSCVHLDPGAVLRIPYISHATAFLVVHGRVTSSYPALIDFLAGTGCVFQPGEKYDLASELGAVLIVGEYQQLRSHPRGISSPEFIWGDTFPSDALPSR